MFQSRRSTHAVVALTVFLIAACGGSSSPKPTAQSTSTDSQSSQQTSSSSGSDGDSASSSSGGGGAPTIVDATYARGSGHIEFSGDASKSADLTAVGGFTISGVTSVTLTDASTQNALSVSTSKNSGETTGISATVGGIATAGEFGKDCQLTVTKNDASEFAGKIQCNDIQGIENSTIYGHLKVTATFSAKP